MRRFPTRHALTRQWWTPAPTVPGSPPVDPPGDPDVPTLTVSDGGDLFTASYATLTNERNKPPKITDVEITSSTGVVEIGATLTAVITGEVNGPYAASTHEYQWYTTNTVMDGVYTAITGATGATYVPVSADYGKYITVKARFVQNGGSNNTSDYMWAELTDAVVEASVVNDGDINHLWEDFFKIEDGGASVPANWNDAGVAPSLINLGEGFDWTTTATTKPLYDNINGELVFDGGHRITGVSNPHPAVFEVWVKARFTGGAGILLSHGNQTIFGTDTSNNWISNNLPPQAGDLNEHVFRIVFNGINSKFQVDGGSEVIFDENTGIGTTLNIGCTNSGVSFGEFELKRFQRTTQGTLLTAQEVADKWAFHGFGGDINYAWDDFFDIEGGLSAQADWNTAVDPVLTNLGARGNWTTVDASKPTLNVDRLVFANAHRVAGLGQTHPPVVEIWVKGKFTAANGAMIGWGSQTLFGMNASNEYFIRDIVMGTGDFNEHVFRIVLNGINSKFQIDGGAEVPFTENFTTASSLALGQTFGGASPADCEIKRLQRTPDGQLLTAQQVADKWAYHGF